MADVRLTATNPEDSSVVPVACDAAGRLLLEEPQVIEGPPGPPGEQGPPGQDGQDGQDGDPFSGNFAGDVTFGGSADFAGAVTVSDGGDLTSSIKADGSADFAGGIKSGSNITNGLSINPQGVLQIQRSSIGGSLFSGYAQSTQSVSLQANGDLQLGGIVGPSPNIFLKGSNGSADFVGDVVVGSRSKQWMLVEQGGLCHMVEQVRANTADLVAPAAADGKYPELRDVIAELNIVEKALEEVMVKLRMQVPAGWPVWDGSDANRGDTGEMPTDTP